MQRRLAAIMVADVVGYSRLMAEDHEATMSALRLLRNNLFDPIVKEYRGNVVKRMGDGWIVEFASVTDAVDCAITVQEGLAGHETILLRMGIHSGEVMFEDDDAFGDGVNIAARLEALSKPGEILISDTVQQSLDQKSARHFAKGAARQLKNIPRSVQVWHWPKTALGAIDELPAIAVTDAPGFAVLAVADIETSDNRAEIKNLAAALKGDFASLLSTVEWLDVRTASHGDQNIGYTLNATLRASGDRLRLETRISERPGGEEIWRDSRDGDLREIFDWQDKTAEEICGIVRSQIMDRELRRLGEKDAKELTAHEWLMRGILFSETPSLQNFTQSLDAVNKAMEKGLRSSKVYSRAIIVSLYTQIMGYSQDTEILATRRDEWLREAMALDANDPYTLIAEYMVKASKSSDFSFRTLKLERLYVIEPKSPYIMNHSGWGDLYTGDFAEALIKFDKARKYGPFDPMRAHVEAGMAIAYVALSRFDHAVAHAMDAININDDFPVPYRALAAAEALRGEPVNARKAVESLLRLVPGDNIARIRNQGGWSNTPNMDIYFEGLRKAGLPEK